MSSSRLNLSGVTLCCVDTRAAAQAIHALKHSMRFIDFGDVLFLGDVGFSHHPDLQHTGIRFGAIPALRNIDDYSRFMLHELHAHVHTEHVLVIQWDGFISHPELWRDEYLTTVPAASGNDVEGKAATLNLDFSASYELSDKIEKLEAEG